MSFESLPKCSSANCIILHHVEHIFHLSFPVEEVEDHNRKIFDLYKDRKINLFF